MLRMNRCPISSLHFSSQRHSLGNISNKEVVLRLQSPDLLFKSTTIYETIYHCRFKWLSVCLSVWRSLQLLLRPLQAGLLISSFFLTLNSVELLPEVLLSLQFLFFLLLLHFEVFFVVQMPLLLGFLHLLTVHCTQSIQQRKDLTMAKPSEHQNILTATACFPSKFQEA